MANKYLLTCIFMFLINATLLEARSTQNPSNEVNNFLQSQKIPLAKAHAHNDYEHNKPLFDALANGFCSVEADVHLVGDVLYIAHDRQDVNEKKILQTLYLDTLKEIIEINNGKIYDCAHPFILLIDIKTDGEKTYSEIDKVLENYKDILSYYDNGHLISGPIMAIISGNRPRALMKSQQVRYAFYDGRLSDLDSEESYMFMPLISDNWFNHFSWNGSGEIFDGEWYRLLNIVNRVHLDNRMIRFWNTPDKPGEMRNNFWHILLKANVDLINTDDLDGLRRFLLTYDQ